MKWYPHHVGDFMAACSHLSMLEECAYRRMLDWYYQHEMPLPLPDYEVYRCVRAVSAHERAAVQRILAEFFTEHPDGWHNDRADAVLTQYLGASNVALVEPQSATGNVAPVTLHAQKSKRQQSVAQSARVQRHRQRRKMLRENLKKHGFKVLAATNLQQLILLHQQNGLEVPEEIDATLPTLRSGAFQPLRSDMCEVTRPLKEEKKSSQPSLRSGLEPRAPEPPAALPDPGQLQAIGKAMKAAGLEPVSPHDPRLIALVQRGATLEQFRMAAAAAAARSKNFGYALAILSGWMSDAADLSNANGSQRPGMGPTSASADLLATLAPTVSAKRL